MIGKIADLIKHKYVLWIILAVPAWPYIAEYFSPGRYYPEMLQSSGVLSLQLLALTLSITPISLVLRNWTPAISFALWLVRNRRYFGLASFGYAAIHTVLYLNTVSFDLELAFLEALNWPFGTGWLSLIAMTVLAATSNDWSIRKLGKYWKPVQRLSYVAAIAGFAHWLLLDFFIDNAMKWIIPLLIAKIMHIMIRSNVFPKTLFNSKSKNWDIL